MICSIIYSGRKSEEKFICSLYIVNLSSFYDIFFSVNFISKRLVNIKQQSCKTGDILSHCQSRLRHRINFSSKLPRSWWTLCLHFDLVDDR